MKIWLNGRLGSASEARIDPGDRGLLLGDGLFETMRAKAGAPLRLGAHLRRLRQGAEVLRLALPWEDDQLTEALESVLSANSLPDAVLRLTVSRGTAARGLLPPGNACPMVLISAAPLPSPLGPARIVVARSVRRNEYSPLSRIKSLNRLDDILARVEAADRRADDALLLNAAGRVAEATAANLVLVNDRAMTTPPVRDGALPGTVRATLIAAHGLRERPVLIEDLYGAKEVFLVNALGIRPVIAVDEIPIAGSTVGALTRELAVSLF